MIVFPAIDLIAGQVVRLERGDRAHMKVYSSNPVAVAEHFKEQGAAWLHVVDLSAALEEDEEAREANDRAIEALCHVPGLSIDVGGGVRSLARIDQLAAYGAKRIALGTVLVREPGFAEVAARGFGELLVADVAARDGQVKVNGWREGVGRSAEDVVGELEHFAQGIIEGEADAVLAASVFHFGTFSIRQVKEYMAAQGIPVRLDF